VHALSILLLWLWFLVGFDYARIHTSKAFGELISLCAFCKSSNIFHFIADTQTQEVGGRMGGWCKGGVCVREGHARPGPKGAQANNICQCWQYFTPEWSVATGCPQFTAQFLAKGPEDLKKPHKSFPYSCGQKKGTPNVSLKRQLPRYTFDFLGQFVYYVFIYCFRSHYNTLVTKKNTYQWYYILMFKFLILISKFYTCLPIFYRKMC